jgi:pyruvate, water dikinase
LKNTDVELVGGKNASIGEMISGLPPSASRCPGGFATTAHAYRDFLAQAGSTSASRTVLAALDVDDVAAAAAGAQIRGWMLATPFPERLRRKLLEAWRAMGSGPNSRSRCAPRRPPRICRKPRSPASRRRS